MFAHFESNFKNVNTQSFGVFSYK